MWWRGKKGTRWQPESEADYWRGMDIQRLRDLREIVREVWRKKYGSGEELPIGFVPRTFALGAIDQAGFHDSILGAGADKLLRSYALYQRIQVSDGDWLSGPLNWSAMAAVYPDRKGGG
jgi:hypothetical protein